MHVDVPCTYLMPENAREAITRTQGVRLRRDCCVVLPVVSSTKRWGIDWAAETPESRSLE